MTTFINPTLYLLAMGVGLGSFVNSNGHESSLGGVSYLQYVAPGLAAVAAATTAAGEALFPVMGAIKWQRTYLAMLSTPLRIGDVLGGHLTWMAARVTMAVSAYVIVMAAFSTTASWQAVAVVPAGVLTGMAFAAPLAAFAATQDSDSGFVVIFRLGIVPLFLFSGCSSRSAAFQRDFGFWPTSVPYGTGSTCAGASHSEPPRRRRWLCTSATSFRSPLPACWPPG